MNEDAPYEVHLTEHAYRRYLERVGSMDRQSLEQWMNEQIQNQNFLIDSGFIQLADIWWAFNAMDEAGNDLRIVTCYGRTLLDLPKAIGWARRHRDGINLDELPVIEDGSAS